MNVYPVRNSRNITITGSMLDSIFTLYPLHVPHYLDCVHGILILIGDTHLTSHYTCTSKSPTLVI